jgi:hypothetical protein
MTVKHLSGRRIQGQSGDFAPTPAVAGGWVEVGRTTLGSAGDTIEVGSIPDKRYYKVLWNGNPSGNLDDIHLTLGNSTIDTGSNYARRLCNNGGSEETAINQSSIDIDRNNGAYDRFGVMYIANLSGKEKLVMSNRVHSYTTGSGTAPLRCESVGKWANTSNPLDILRLTNVGTGDFAIGSEVVVLGWDDSDTHTDNFWEPLGSTTLATAGDNIEVTFTAKKYLMVKLYRKPTGAADARWTFNNDGGANYAQRTSGGGGSDSESIDQNYFTQYTYSNDDPSYSSTIIVNTAGAEKLGIQHEVNRRVSGADNYPVRSESFFKWDNTSDQITTIDITNSKSGSYDVGSIIEVWGHD